MQSISEEAALPAKNFWGNTAFFTQRHCLQADLPFHLPNLPFLSAASNAILKPGDPLTWKMRLVKDVRQGALIRLERWSEYWCLPLNPSKYEASFYVVDPYQANLQPSLSLFNSRLRFNSTPTFLGVTFDRLSFLFKTCIFAEGQVFPSSQGLTLYLCFLMGSL